MFWVRANVYKYIYTYRQKYVLVIRSQIYIILKDCNLKINDSGNLLRVHPRPGCVHLVRSQRFANRSFSFPMPGSQNSLAWNEDGFLRQSSVNLMSPTRRFEALPLQILFHHNSLDCTSFFFAHCVWPFSKILLNRVFICLYIKRDTEIRTCTGIEKMPSKKLSKLLKNRKIH